MDSTPPVTLEVPHVHGTQSRDLPGLYNTSCSPFASSPCISQLNLVCVNDLCVCISNYVPDGSGGCEPDMVTLLVTWMIRVFVCTAIFIICLSIFHMILTRRCCRRSSGGGQGGEGEAEEGRRGSTSTCWYDEPPSYLDVADEAPPPTYLEAVAKECMSSGGPTRGATERAAPPQPPAPPLREEERGVEALTFTPPLAPPDTAPPQTLHM